MGFFSKTPKPPPPNENLSKVSPSHEWTYYDDQGKHRVNCNCDTGRDHTTPRER